MLHYKKQQKQQKHFTLMAKRNPYAKYLKGEDLLQRAVLNYIGMQYPDVVFTHPMNEGKRTPFEQYKLKYLGTKAGIPDIMIFTPNSQNNGLAIELKYKYNKPTPSQKEWLKWLKNCNWVATWHNNFDDCKNTIDNYFKNS